MKKTILLIAATSLFIANTSAADCWANKYNRDCCSENAKLIYTDSRGQWGFQNGRLCGIAPKTTTTTKRTRSTRKRTTTTTTTKKECPTVTFPLDKCTNKGGRSTRTTITGCPIPTCVFDEECWSEKLGYPCCTYYNDRVESVDANGQWGSENGQKCGIRGTRPPTTTTTTTVKKECPIVTFPLDRCTNKGGRSTRTTITGCPIPTCVFDEECWSEKFGYPCCSYYIENVISSDAYGNYSEENGKKCGIRGTRPPIPITTTTTTTTTTSTTSATTTTTTTTITTRVDCPRYTFPLDRCTNKGGRSTQYTTTGCAVPTCVFDEECWSEKLGYPCCSYYIDRVESTDENGQWGSEDGHKCGLRGTRPPIPITRTTTTIKTKINCPVVTFPLDRCTNKGGRSTQYTSTGCVFPTCVFDEECWSEKLGYPCCTYYNDRVESIDANGQWGIESGKKCGIRGTRPPVTTTIPITKI